MEEEKKAPKGRKRKITGILILAVAAVFAGMYIYNESKYQSTDDAYIEAHMIRIAPKVTGEIVELNIKDNQRIKEGDIVARIEDSEYLAKAEQARANYKKALFAQQGAKADLEAANSNIELARTDLERYEKLYATGAVSKQVLDNARTRYKDTLARHTNADQAVFSKNSNTVADANLKYLKAKKDEAELDLSYTVVRAPQSGTVTNKSAEKGAYVQTGSPLFVLVPDEVWVVANFKESQVGKMHPGQSVDIKIDSYPGKVFKGKIDSIQQASGAKSSLFPPENAVGSFVKIVQRIPVKIVFTEKIDKNEYNIVAGMSVIPKVKLK